MYACIGCVYQSFWSTKDQHEATCGHRNWPDLPKGLYNVNMVRMMLMKRGKRRMILMVMGRNCKIVTV